MLRELLALAYIVVADHSSPEARGRMMGTISFVWGLASILGPALGGFVIAWLSWRWIFYINLPLGSLALLGIYLFLKDTRLKKQEAPIDVLGATTLCISVLSLLVACMLGGRSLPWVSAEMGTLGLVTLLSGGAFVLAEKRAREPILDLMFFAVRGFSMGNASAFFSSVAVFSLSAFAPIFIQGALGRPPAQLGITMVFLSLAWSLGAFLCGRIVNRRRERILSILGSAMLACGSGWMLLFSPDTTLLEFSAALALAGMGMGFVSISTLLAVQNSLDESDLGIATSSQQFSRTLGGTIGIGVCGSLVSLHLGRALESLRSSGGDMGRVPEELAAQISRNMESLLDPGFQQMISPQVLGVLQGAVTAGVRMVFWCTLAASLVSLLFCLRLPASAPGPKERIP